jgi:hypothetical protein
MGIANLKELLRDERIWCIAARVDLHDGQTSHFETNDEGDVIVSVRTVIHDQQIWANLDSMAGGSDGSGVWHIPDPGTEVVICFDQGDFEGEAYIVGRTSGGRAPQGLTSGTIFILGNNVQVRSPSGVANKLPTFDDLSNLKDYVNAQFSSVGGHTHAVVGGATTTTTTVASGGTPPTHPASDPTGTTVLEAE